MTLHVHDVEGTFELFLYRLSGAAVFDSGIYESIEADPQATKQAVAVVLLSAVASGIGAGGLVGPHPLVLAAISALALVTWLAWGMLMFQIGTRLLPEPQTSATLGQLLRTTGFAASPGLLQVFAILPGMAIPVFVGVWLWMIGAMIVGVRHALDYESTGRAVAVCVVAVALALVLAFGFGAIVSPVLS
jgi:Yip1-like protein